jgi:hypothetical protein
MPRVPLQTAMRPLGQTTKDSRNNQNRDAHHFAASDGTTDSLCHREERSDVAI